MLSLILASVSLSVPAPAPPLTRLGEPPATESIEVVITSPTSGKPQFGEVDFAAEAFPSDEVERVEFFVDGKRVGEVGVPPFRLSVDVGQENREHHFTVKAHGWEGGLGEDRLVTPPVRIDLEVDAGLQQLYVTVTADGRRVLDLVQRDFTVLDEGVPQQIVTFARGDVRLTAAILVDASTSMSGERLRFALRGATAFLQGMKPSDETGLVVFSDRLLHDTPFSSDVDFLTRGLENVAASGGTALNDHLYLALKRLEYRQGRRVVVILSDGIDSHSALRMEEVTWLARRSRALIYWIRVGNEGDRSRYSAWKNAQSYRDEFRLLERTVTESGGRVVPIEHLDDADQAFRDILQELREQYVLGYYPSTDRDDGTWHSVQVDVQRSGTKVRAKRGYVDY